MTNTTPMMSRILQMVVCAAALTFAISGCARKKAEEEKVAAATAPVAESEPALPPATPADPPAAATTEPVPEPAAATPATSTVDTPSPPPAPTLRHPLSLRAHDKQSLDESTGDRIIGEMSALLAQCGTDAARTGAVLRYSGVSGVVNSGTDFDAQFTASPQSPPSATAGDSTGVSRTVAVVNAMTWCNAFTPGVIGCADNPGLRVAVVRYTKWTGAESIMWTHEFAHTKGLTHAAVDTQVMNEYLCDTCVEFTKDDCQGIRQVNFGAQSGKPGGASALVVPIEKFVARTYPHGVPYREARQYKPEEARRLIPLLNDAQQMDDWPNIVATIAIVADKTAFPVLYRFIMREGEGVLDARHYRAKATAISSLGYVVYGSKDEKALQFLQQQSNPEAWKAVRWFAPYNQDNPAARNLELSQSAVIGLALSADQRAVTALAVRRRSADQYGDVPLLDEARRASEIIRARGMEAYQETAR